MGLLLKLLVSAAGLAVAAWVLPGIHFTGPRGGTAELQDKVLPLLAVALILTLVNTFVRPVLKLLSLPITLLTLGLFLLVINALMLLLTGALAHGLGLDFQVDGFVPALIGGLIVTAVTWAVEAVLGKE